MLLTSNLGFKGYELESATFIESEEWRGPPRGTGEVADEVVVEGGDVKVCSPGESRILELNQVKLHRPLRRERWLESRVQLELELELIQTHMTQKPMLRLEVGALGARQVKN